MRVLGDRGKSYQIQWDEERQKLTCSCPDFKYVRDDKSGGSCKHIRRVMREGLIPKKMKRKMEKSMNIEDLLSPGVFASFNFNYPSKLAAEKDEKVTTKVLKAIDTARPIAYRGVMGAVPGALLGGALASDKLKGARIGAALGGAVGVSDKLLEHLSKKRGFKKVLKTYKEDKL